MTPRLKRALELARAEARRRGHRCVGTEHVLLGIARLDEGVGAVAILFGLSRLEPSGAVRASGVGVPGRRGGGREYGGMEGDSGYRGAFLTSVALACTGLFAASMSRARPRALR